MWTWIGVGIGAVGLVLLLVFVRAVHLGRLLVAAEAPLTAPPDEDAPLVGSNPRTISDEAAEVGLASALGIPAQALWELSRIDGSVVDAISAASSHASGTPAVDDTYRGFLDYVHAHAGVLDTPGYTSRLIGYVGEQQAADALTAQGHVVVMAATSNNPGWDMLVDGHAVNIKTYQDASQMAHHAAANPNVDFLVPHDAAHVPDLGNVHTLGGLSYTDAHHAFTSSVDAGHSLASGDFVGDAMSHGVPVTLIAFAAWRQVKAVQAGKSIADASVDFAVDSAVRAGGMLAGAKSGAIAGAWAGPHGAAIGAVVGGIFGSIGGAQVSRWVQDKPIRDAEGRLKDSLADYGKQFMTPENLDVWTRLIWAPAERSRVAYDELLETHQHDRRTIRWKLWPTPEQALRCAALNHGAKVLQEQAAEADAEAELWNGVLEADDAAVYVGLAMANAPAAAVQFEGIQSADLKRIEQDRTHLAQVRKERSGH